MKKITLILIIVWVALVAFEYWLNYTNVQIKTLHIKKITLISNSGNLKYKIFANEGVFVNADRILLGKFNSSDLQNKLLNKKICRVKIIGHRIRILSSYPNIVNIIKCK